VCARHLQAPLCERSFSFKPKTIDEVSHTRLIELELWGAVPVAVLQSLNTGMYRPAQETNVLEKTDLHTLQTHGLIHNLLDLFTCSQKSSPKLHITSLYIILDSISLSSPCAYPHKPYSESSDCQSHEVSCSS
jgi:hypothetical protein